MGIERAGLTQSRRVRTERGDEGWRIPYCWKELLCNSEALAGRPTVEQFSQGAAFIESARCARQDRSAPWSAPGVTPHRPAVTLAPKPALRLSQRDRREKGRS